MKAHLRKVDGGADPRNHHTRRRGATAVFVCVMMPVLIGMAALTIDVGVLHNTRADLQRSADAAAHAAALAYMSDEMQIIRAGDGGSIAAVQAEGNRNIKALEPLNGSFGIEFTGIDPGDVRFGYLDLDSATSTLDTGADPSTWNAVHVMAQRTRAGGNAAVALWFSQFFGKQTSDISASAVAAFDDRVVGVNPTDIAAALLPISMAVAEFNAQMALARDIYSSDGTLYPDGATELRAFPDIYAPGNFGLLGVGMNNSSATDLRFQIENGISAAEVYSEIGQEEFIFFDPDGDPITYDVDGTPGLKASLESSFADHIGELVAFFVHDSATGTGTNSIYTVSGIKFGWLVDVKIKGNSADRSVTIQPATYIGPGLIIDERAPSSGGVAGQLVLAR